MKIKVKTTFRRAFSLMLCMVMLFGIAPFSGMVAGAAGDYTITCYQSSNESVVLWQASYNEGDTLDVPANVIAPTRTGYTFDYWSVAIPATMPAHDISTTAQWKVNQYTIKFENTGDTAIDPIKQDYGSTIVKPANPTREGYTFAGWSEAIPGKMPANDMVITAKWNINKHKITFNSNGGSAVEPIEKDFGEKLDTTIVSTREGYTFIGWEPAIPGSMPDKDMTLTAQWQVNKYKIDFINTGDTVIAPIEQDYNTTIVKPEAPKRVGYTFAGWSVDIPDKMPAKNMTIKAEWIPNNIEITYDPNGGLVENIYTDDPVDTTGEAIKINYTFGVPFAAPENSVINPDNPTRPGYTFLGWYDADGNIRPTDVPAAPTTYYAKWIEGDGGCFYKVTTYRMDENGEYQFAGENLFSGAEGAFVYAEVDTSSGFSIDGAKSTLTGSLASTNGIDNPLQLSVYIKRNTYTITFNVAGGTAIAPIEALYGKVVTVPANPTKAGYTFDGWVNDGTGKPDTIPTIMPAADTSFTAQWVANGDTHYQVIVAYKDVTDNNTLKQKTYDFYGTTGRKVKIDIAGNITESGVITHSVNEFQIEHYKVDTSAAGLANQVLEATIAANGTTILKLSYIPVKYKVTFTVAGKVYDTKEVQYYDHANTVEPTEEAMNAHFATEMPGYTFNGWEPELDRVTGDTTYKALYNSKPYTITFDYVKVVYDENGNEITSNVTPDAGQELDAVTKDFNTSVTIPNYPVKTGYTCIGWYDAAGKVYAPGQKVMMPENGIALTAKYTANVYTINFVTNLDGATSVDSISAPCDDEVTLPAYPVKEGCKCIGWYADDVRYEAGAKVTMPVNGMTFKAQWDIGKFNIIYKDGDADLSEFTKKDISCGDRITAPNYPTAADPQGRTFVGWREKGKTNLFTHNEMPGYSLTLEAVWGYTVTFIDDNGALIKKVAVEPGAKIVAPAIPDRIGTVVVGWVDLPETMPAKDIVIKAARTYNQYTVTYKVDGDVYAQQTYQYGQDIQEIDAPRKWFKKFVGWSELPDTMPAYDIEVNAEWTDSDFVKGIKAFFGGIAKLFEIILGFIE